MRSPTAKTDMMEVARQAVALAKKHGAREAAATTTRDREVELRWRDGKLEKVSEATTRGLSLQLYVEGRYSAASTSDLRPEALDAFVREAAAMTRRLAADEHRRLPEPELYAGRSQADLRLEDPAQRELTMEERRRYSQAMEEAARAADKKGVILSVTASFGDSEGESHRVSSNGFEGSQRATIFSASAEVSVKDADGRRPEEYDYAVSHWRADMPAPEEIGRRASERALGRLGSKKAKSAKMTMVVDHRAAGRLVSMVLDPLTGMAVQQKRSFLDGKLGAKVGSDVFTLSDDPLLERGLGSRTYDREGISSHARPIFEAGVLKTYFIDTYYARKLGTAPTTTSVSNLAWKLGAKTQAALLAEVKDGILVTGFLGGNSNPATGDFSFGVQGYRIHGGRMAEPVGEMNIAGNQADLWKRLVLVGNDPFAYSSMRTPTLVFEKVDFAGV